MLLIESRLDHHLTSLTIQLQDPETQRAASTRCLNIPLYSQERIRLEVCCSNHPRNLSQISPGPRVVPAGSQDSTRLSHPKNGAVNHRIDPEKDCERVRERRKKFRDQTRDRKLENRDRKPTRQTRNTWFKQTVGEGNHSHRLEAEGKTLRR